MLILVVDVYFRTWHMLRCTNSGRKAEFLLSEKETWFEIATELLLLFGGNYRLLSLYLPQKFAC